MEMIPVFVTLTCGLPLGTSVYFAVERHNWIAAAAFFVLFLAWLTMGIRGLTRTRYL